MSVRLSLSLPKSGCLLSVWSLPRVPPIRWLISDLEILPILNLTMSSKNSSFAAECGFSPMASTSSSGENCYVCLEPLQAPYCIQGNCSHIVCATCLIAWRENAGQNMACPVCRIKSNEVLIWPVAGFATEEEKKRTFAYQAKLAELKEAQLKKEKEYEVDILPNGQMIARGPGAAAAAHRRAFGLPEEYYDMLEEEESYHESEDDSDGEDI